MSTRPPLPTRVEAILVLPPALALFVALSILLSTHQWALTVIGGLLAGIVSFLVIVILNAVLPDHDRPHRDRERPDHRGNAARHPTRPAH